MSRLLYRYTLLVFLPLFLAACQNTEPSEEETVNASLIESSDPDMLEEITIQTVNAGKKPDNETDEPGKASQQVIHGAFSLMVLGSGGPSAMPSGKASSGYLIFIDEKPRILVDAGGGTFQRLAEAGIDIADIELVLLTHLHIDHTADLPAILKSVYFHARAAGKQRRRPFKIFGPGESLTKTPYADVPQYPASSQFVEAYFGVKGIYRYLNIFTNAIDGGQFSYTATDLASDPDNETMTKVYEEGTPDDLLVESLGVRHGPVPAVAYRISYRGKSIAISGDTNSSGNNMLNISNSSDLLVYDTAIMDDAPDCNITPAFCALHTTPSRMGEITSLARPKKLVLSHLTGFTMHRLQEVEETLRSKGFKGEIDIAADLKTYNLLD